MLNASLSSLRLPLPRLVGHVVLEGKKAFLLHVRIGESRNGSSLFAEAEGSSVVYWVEADFTFFYYKGEYACLTF